MPWAGDTDALLDEAEACGDPAMIRRLLTFVIVGGGPTGVEMAGTIAELARSTLPGDFATSTIGAWIGLLVIVVVRRARDGTFVVSYK